MKINFLKESKNIINKEQRFLCNFEENNFSENLRRSQKCFCGPVLGNYNFSIPRFSSWSLIPFSIKTFLKFSIGKRKSPRQEKTEKILSQTEFLCSTKSSEIQFPISRLPQKLILKILRASKIIFYDSSQSTQLDKVLTGLPSSVTYHWISIFDPKSSQDLFQSSQSSSGSLILNKSFSLKSLWSQGQPRII